ncbi:MAG: leucine-rich repeat domain-containing protein [Bacteroidaceae bacterium]|nr:leucine-rich repeat domain-containing protein [Bacteroidaceae bacterium]
MKKYNLFLFTIVAMFCVSSHSAWAQYVKVTAEDGTVSWAEIAGDINGTDIEIHTNGARSTVLESIKGAIDLNEVWSESGGNGTHYQVTSIADYSFYNCSGLTNVSIPEGVTSIGLLAFANCSGLTSVSIPTSVTSIKRSPFYSCSGLASIVVASGNPAYDSRNNCNAIIETATNTLILGCMNTTIPTSVNTIGEHAYFGCTGLTNLFIPLSVTSIGENAFTNCTGLTSIIIPESVTNIGVYAFASCTGLTRVRISEGVTNIADYAFSYCSRLTSINIPTSVTSISAGVFWACSGLTNFSIPTSITRIERIAFAYCTGLESISIPESVTSIGEEAFAYCSRLTSITSYITDVFATGRSAFGGCYDATLYVPKGTVRSYLLRGDWNSISSIKEIPIDLVMR